MNSEIEYHLALLEQKSAEHKVKKCKRAMNKELRKEHKWIFRILDIFIVVIILSNIGAMAITNALVIKNEPDKILVEANPVTAEKHDLVSANEVYGNNVGSKFMLTYMINILVYALFLAFYFKTKYFSYNTKTLYANLFAFTFIVVALFFDFVNDLGFWIGKLIWGG